MQILLRQQYKLTVKKLSIVWIQITIPFPQLCAHRTQEDEQEEKEDGQISHSVCGEFPSKH